MIVAVVIGFCWDRSGMAYLGGMIGSDVVVSGVVQEDPESDGSSVVLRLGDLKMGGEIVPGKVYAQVSSREKIERSDTVVLKGKISEGFGVFWGAMWRPFLQGVAKPDPPDVPLMIRDWFGELVRRFVPEPQVNLSQGYLLGQKRSLPEDFSNLLNEVGLTHMVVASGYNLSILVGVSRKIFRGVSRFACLLFGLLLVLGFAGITGLSASMMRAGIVTSLSMFAWYYGRKFHPVKLLLLVAAISLLINPIYIVDLGWMLSFASFAGVMIVGPILLKYFYGDKKPNFVAAVLVETVAAQICCLPIILFFSGSFSLVGILANILILPTIPVTMGLTFATGCLAFLPPVAAVTGWAAYILLSYHIGVVNFFGEMKWAIFAMEPGNVLVLFLYLVAGLAVFYMAKRTKFRLMDVNVVEF